MYSYSYTPPRDGKKSAVVTFSGFLVGFLFLYISGLLPMPVIYQIIGICIISLSIFVGTRYLVKHYVYSVVKVGDNDYDFVVNEVSGGKKSVPVCRINMDDITDFVKSEGGKVPGQYAGKSGRDILRFNYCQDIVPKESYYLYATIREGRVALRISPDEKLKTIIKSLMPKIYEKDMGFGE